MSDLNKAKDRAKRIGKRMGQSAIGRVSPLEPGDATRYDLLLMRDHLSGSLIFGWLNSMARGGRVMRLPDYEAVPDAGYIADKLDIRAEYEAQIFEAWLEGVLS